MYSVIVVVTLVVFDFALMALGLFPPSHNFGRQDVGWVAAEPSGQMRIDQCVEYASGEARQFTRNEDGYRTALSSSALSGPGELFEVAVTGDSHTDLCAANELTHFGVMERSLADNGIRSAAYAFGAGRYSPLQAYLAVRPGIEKYEPDALVLNLYTGNDFYDILRVDDRPHFVAAGESYQIAPPVWFEFDPPDRERRSRVLYAARQITQALGIRGLLLRVGYLRAAADDQSIFDVFTYMNDLRIASSDDVGYSGAFLAQMLNQQLFFHHFPSTSAESLRRIQTLLEMIRRAHPDLVLVLSPIPSYQLVGEQPVDQALMRVLERLPITYDEGIQQEQSLYDQLDDIALSAQWLFVDNLTALRTYDGGERLFNDFDYHIEPIASDIIGRQQAVAIAANLRDIRSRS